MKSAGQAFSAIRQYVAKLDLVKSIDLPTIDLPSRAILLPLSHLFPWRSGEFRGGALGRAKKSASPLTRDAAAFFEELAGGRKRLGKIKDLGKMRADFLALDLDPKRAAEREREDQARKAAEEARREADAAAAETMAAALDRAGLVAAAWEHIGNAVIIRSSTHGSATSIRDSARTSSGSRSSSRTARHGRIAITPRRSTRSSRRSREPAGPLSAALHAAANAGRAHADVPAPAHRNPHRGARETARRRCEERAPDPPRRRSLGRRAPGARDCPPHVGR